MATIIDIIKASLIALIKMYQFTISGLLGACCRYEPSCSVYALEAIRLHGCFRGSFLGLRRLLRCHPWHPGGIDPVPQGKMNIHKRQ